MLKKTKTKNIDYTLLGLTLALLGFGLAVLYSASTVESFNNYGNTTYLIKHQALYGGLIGIIAMLALSKLDYHVWQKYLPVVLFGSLICLVLVKIPGFGFSANGATRWIHLGPLLFQPSELAKLAVILYLAAWAEKKKNSLENFYFDLLPSFCIVGLFALLIIMQPDLGTMLVIVLIAAVLMFAGGIPMKYFFMSGSVGIFLLYLVIHFEPYRVRRLTTFFNPQIDPTGISYQVNQALIAVGSGGWFGYGYGLSRQKYNYLPETISDSIFAVLAEELGFLRATGLLLLFAAFAFRGIQIAKNAPDTFGKMVALGITAWITLQALVNIGAIVGLLPLTGIPLPFFSYGSTSLIMILGSVGILLNISRQSSLS